MKKVKIILIVLIASLIIYGGLVYVSRMNTNAFTTYEAQKTDKEIAIDAIKAEKDFKELINILAEEEYLYRQELKISHEKNSLLERKITLKDRQLQQLTRDSVELNGDLPETIKEELKSR